MKKRMTSSKPVDKKKTETPVIRDGDYAMASNGQDGNRVFVSVGKTINIGNYESIKVEMGVGRTVPDGCAHARYINMCASEALEDCLSLIKEVEKTLS